MANVPSAMMFVSHISSSPRSPSLLPAPYDISRLLSSAPVNPLIQQQLKLNYGVTNSKLFSVSYRLFTNEDAEEDDDAEDYNFADAVTLFNNRDYYECHDYLEALWNTAEDPTRTLIHGILQCAVGFHHLFNQNHKGAMMELGEGLCKLRKMNFQDGPFHQFEQDVSEVLNFIYQTQIELAACGDDFCVTMDQSERSYQLLGGYAVGQHVYTLQMGPNDTQLYLVFCPPRTNGTVDPPRVRLPVLKATTEHLLDFEK